MEKFDTLNDLCKHLAELLADKTPIGWHREVGLRANDDGTFSLIHLTDPLTSNTFTLWAPASPNEIKVFISPCRERGTACPNSGIICSRDDEVDCTANYLEEKISEAFNLAATHPHEIEYRYWSF